jgi:hypothetical protein
LRLEPALQKKIGKLIDELVQVNFVGGLSGVFGIPNVFHVSLTPACVNLAN